MGKGEGGELDLGKIGVPVYMDSRHGGWRTVRHQYRPSWNRVPYPTPLGPDLSSLVLTPRIEGSDPKTPGGQTREDPVTSSNPLRHPGRWSGVGPRRTSVEFSYVEGSNLPPRGSQSDKKEDRSRFGYTTWWRSRRVTILSSPPSTHHAFSPRVPTVERSTGTDVTRFHFTVSSST